MDRRKCALFRTSGVILLLRLRIEQNRVVLLQGCGSYPLLPATSWACPLLVISSLCTGKYHCEQTTAGESSARRRPSRGRQQQSWVREQTCRCRGRIWCHYCKTRANERGDKWKRVVITPACCLSFLSIIVSFQNPWPGEAQFSRHW